MNGDLARFTRLLCVGTHPVGYKASEPVLSPAPPLSSWCSHWTGGESGSAFLRAYSVITDRITDRLGPFRSSAGPGGHDGPARRRKPRPPRGGPAAPCVRGGRQRQGEHSQWLPPAAALSGWKAFQSDRGREWCQQTESVGPGSRRASAARRPCIAPHGKAGSRWPGCSSSPGRTGPPRTEPARPPGTMRSRMANGVPTRALPPRRGRAATVTAGTGAEMCEGRSSYLRPICGRDSEVFVE